MSRHSWNSAKTYIESKVLGEDSVVDMGRTIVGFWEVCGHALTWHISQSRRKLSHAYLQLAKHGINRVFDGTIIADICRFEVA
jgi:hypothetical protein